VRDLFVDVRPEFLHHNRDRIEADLRSPHARGIAQGSIGGDEQVRIRRSADEGAPGMVAVGRDCGCGCAAHNFREVELRVPVVGASHEDPANGITGTREKTAVPGLIKPRILAQG
jgi:hypothetical protein